MTAQLVLTQLVADSFDRANGALGAGWAAAHDGGLSIVSNRAASTSGTSNQQSYRTGETYSGDQYAACTIPAALAANSYIGLALRNSANGNDSYALLAFNDGTNDVIQMFKRLGGGGYTSATKVAISNPGAYWGSGGTSLMFVAEGTGTATQLTGYANGQAVITIPDDGTWNGAPIDGGAPGVVAFNLAALDNFTAGNASTPALPSALASDNFNRANAGASAGQANWAIDSNYPAVDIPIVSNELNSGGTGIHNVIVRTDNIWSADQWSSIRRGTTAPWAFGGFLGLLHRMSSDGKSGYLGCLFNQSGPTVFTGVAPSYLIYRIDNAVSTPLGGAYSTGLGLDPAGTDYEFVSEGNRHSWRRKGKEVLAVTDSTYPTGKLGIMLYPTATGDNWSAGNIAVPVSNVAPAGIPSGEALGVASVTATSPPPAPPVIATASGVQPDFNGFANAQASLRQAFGRDVRFYRPADITYDPSIPKSAFDEEGIPLDPLAQATVTDEAQVEIGDLTVLATLQHCLIVFRPLASSIMRRDQTFETPLGIYGGLNKDLILDPTSAPAIAGATYYQIGWLARDDAGKVVEPEQWTPEEDELWKIVDGKLDQFGPVLRYIVYGQGTR